MRRLSAIFKLGFYLEFFPLPFRAILGEIVEDLVEIVDAVDERLLADEEDDDLELGFGESISSRVGVGGVDSLLRDGPGFGVDSLLCDNRCSVCVPTSMVVCVPTVWVGLRVKAVGAGRFGTFCWIDE